MLVGLYAEEVDENVPLIMCMDVTVKSLSVPIPTVPKVDVLKFPDKNLVDECSELPAKGPNLSFDDMEVPHHLKKFGKGQGSTEHDRHVLALTFAYACSTLSSP